METLLAGLSAFWIGVMTSIGPCPLATNIAAITYISKQIKNKKLILLTGILYTTGRSFAYITLSFLIIKSILAIPGLSNSLQNHMYKILGPLLVVIGMFLLELIYFPLPLFLDGIYLQKLFRKMSIWGAFPLGIIFALSFCPVSAALFFGSLIPLSIKFSSSFFLPAIYGIGTGAPVLFFAILITYSANYIGKSFKKIEIFEYWFRMISGVIFILIGIYLTLANIFTII